MGSKEKERKFLLECIELYRNLPALWNTKSKDYTNRPVKNIQYDLLLQKYRERYPEADRTLLVKKLNSLRTNFRKELRRIKNSNGSDVRLEPTLWYFNEFRFLYEVEMPCSSKRPMNDDDDDEVIIKEEYAEDVSDTIDQTIFCDENNSLTPSEVLRDLSRNEISTADLVTKETEPPRKKVKKTNDSEKLISLVCEKLEHKETEYEKLASTWANDLERMQPSQRLFAKKFISDILFEGLMGTLHRDSVQINKTSPQERHFVDIN